MAIPELTTCRVIGPVLDPNGRPIAGGSIDFSISRWDRDGDISIMPVPLRVAINSSGYFEVDLWPNAAGLAGTYYTSVIRSVTGATLAKISLVVPETPTANYADIVNSIPPESVDDAQDAANRAAQSAASAEADRVQTGLDRIATGEDRIQTNADVLSTTSMRDAAQDAQLASEVAALGSESAKEGADETLQEMITQLSGFPGWSATAGELSPPAKDIVSATDVTDFFIYDTSKDSDGGAWRKRCNWTSWFKETLNTATRGARNQFPQKALIVARPASVTIYDLDQASCPMWMAFPSSGSGVVPSHNGTTSVTALNGLLLIGDNRPSGDPSYGVAFVDFVRDRMWRNSSWTEASRDPNASVATRSTAIFYNTGALTPLIVNGKINDVAATILPGTPVDRVRKLPTPTVAVATAGGVSVIHWDGRVANSGSTSARGQVGWSKGFLWCAPTGVNRAVEFAPVANILVTSFTLSYFGGGRINFVGAGSDAQKLITCADEVAAGNSGGLTKIQRRGPYTIDGAIGQAAAESIAFLTSKYNTGYMIGDTKLALAESTADLTSLVQGTADFADNSAELAVNGGFDSDTGWSKTNVTISAGEAQFGPSATLSQGTTVVGQRYKITYTITAINPGSSGIQPFAGTTGAGTRRTAPGTYTEYITAAGAPSFYFFTGSGFVSGSIDNVSIKRAVTTVLYDDFGGYADTAALLGSWTQIVDGTATVTLGSNGIVLTNDASAQSGRAYKAIPAALTIGATYRLQALLVARSDTAFAARLNVTSSTALVNASGAISTTAAAGGIHTYTFVATATTMYVHAYNQGVTNKWAEWDNIRVDALALDRSVAANHPLVYGTVTRTAVATGAELAAYGGFSTSNYLELPYSSGFDVGTGEFLFAGWVNPANLTGGQTIFDRGGGTSPRIILYTTSGTINGLVDNNSAGSGAVTTTGVVLVVGQPVFVVFLRRSTTLELWLNGVRVGTATHSSSLTNASAVARIGLGNTTTNPWSGTITLPRFSATAPTPQQIRDMYEAERPLFQPNAKCLLPADSVSALAYDDSTDLLHVATTGGMARLKDLLVVSKDTVIKTKVDARSGIVVTGNATTVNGQLPNVMIREELLNNGIQTPYARFPIKADAVTNNATPTVIARIPFDTGDQGLVTVRVKANQYADGAAYFAGVRMFNAYRPEQGNVALRGAVQTIGTDIESTSTMDVTVTANTVTQTFDVTATGIAATNLQWTAEVTIS